MGMGMGMGIGISIGYLNLSGQLRLICDLIIQLPLELPSVRGQRQDKRRRLSSCLTLLLYMA